MTPPPCKRRKRSSSLSGSSWPLVAEGEALDFNNSIGDAFILTEQNNNDPLNDERLKIISSVNQDNLKDGASSQTSFKPGRRLVLQRVGKRREKYICDYNKFEQTNNSRSIDKYLISKPLKRKIIKAFSVTKQESSKSSLNEDHTTPRAKNQISFGPGRRLVLQRVGKRREKCICDFSKFEHTFNSRSIDKYLISKPLSKKKKASVLSVAFASHGEIEPSLPSHSIDQESLNILFPEIPGEDTSNQYVRAQPLTPFCQAECLCVSSKEEDQANTLSFFPLPTLEEVTELIKSDPIFSPLLEESEEKTAIISAKDTPTPIDTERINEVVKECENAEEKPQNISDVDEGESDCTVNLSDEDCDLCGVGVDQRRAEVDDAERGREAAGLVEQTKPVTPDQALLLNRCWQEWPHLNPTITSHLASQSGLPPR